jgi:uncharacterized protein (TIGR02147 family)
MKPLYQYSDYRSYIKELLALRKQKGLPASNRWFAEQAGIHSSSWLTDLLKGRKGMSLTIAANISLLCRHSILEAKYFSALVLFNQAGSNEERNELYREMTRIRQLKDTEILTTEQYDYYAVWYHSVVRSLIGMHGFNGDYKKLAGMVSPAITPSQARKSVELVKRLGLVMVNPQGGYELNTRSVTSGDHEKSLAVVNFQQETMRLAQEAIDRHPKEMRDIFTVTMGISEKNFSEIKQIMDDARKKIVTLAKNETVADRVYQLNVQLFPLSEVRKKKDGKNEA